MAEKSAIRIKMSKDQEIVQAVVRLGSSQCMVLKFNAADEVVVYLNNYSTEMSVGYYLTHFSVLTENIERIKEIINDMQRQVRISF